jgi:hypothetical protein
MAASFASSRAALASIIIWPFVVPSRSCSFWLTYCLLLVLPLGLQEEVYARFEEILTCMKEGKPIPAAKPLPPAAAASAPAPAAEQVILLTHILQKCFYGGYSG